MFDFFHFLRVKQKHTCMFGSPFSKIVCSIIQYNFSLLIVVVFNYFLMIKNTLWFG